MARNQSGRNSESSYFISAQNKTRLNQKYSEWCPEASEPNVTLYFVRTTPITHFCCYSGACKCCHYLLSLTSFQIHMTLLLGSNTKGDFIIEHPKTWSILHNSCRQYYFSPHLLQLLGQVGYIKISVFVSLYIYLYSILFQLYKVNKM